MNFLTSSYTDIWRFRKSNLRVSNLGEDLQTHAANLSFHLPALPWKLNTMESLLICFSVVETKMTGEERGCFMLLFWVTVSLWGTLHRNSRQGPGSRNHGRMVLASSVRCLSYTPGAIAFQSTSINQSRQFLTDMATGQPRKTIFYWMIPLLKWS